MVAVRVMEVIADEVVEVIAVRHGFMPAVRAVDVRIAVSVAVVLRRAVGRVRGVHVDHVLVHVVAVRVVQVPVMQVVDVAFVLERDMAAVRAVLMGMIVMNRVRHADRVVGVSLRHKRLRAGLILRSVRRRPDGITTMSSVRRRGSPPATAVPAYCM